LAVPKFAIWTPAIWTPAVWARAMRAQVARARVGPVRAPPTPVVWAAATLGRVVKARAEVRTPMALALTAPALEAVPATVRLPKAAFPSETPG
jgi:hypothetical protein